MSEEEPIFESEASYYLPATKRWKTGRFSLNVKFIEFNYDNIQSIQISLNSLTGLEKRQSSLIYAAIVISVGTEKHWFASFSNRDSVYNLLELFWREALLSKEHRPVSTQLKPGSSDLGKELLNILYESEATLVNAANALSDQGKQIEETQSTVSDINSDLNVADSFLRKLSFPQSILQMANVSTSNNTEEQELHKCFKVNYTFSDILLDNCYWEKGTLLFNKEKMYLTDENKMNKLSVCHDEVISLKIISKWKFCLTYSDCDVEKSCYIMCPKQIKLLKSLNSTSTKDKIFYLHDNHSPSTSSVIRYIPSPSASTKTTDEIKSDAQLQENISLISDEDFEEISNVLTNLQALALEVSKEQNEQMEKLSSLMSNVEKTDLRMKASSKKMKELT